MGFTRYENYIRQNGGALQPMPWLMLAFSILGSFVVCYNSLKQKRLCLKNVDVLLIIIFQLYWLGVGLFDYANSDNNYQLTAACWMIIVGYPSRYLFFFADRFDRARGIWAGYKDANTDKSWGWGRCVAFAILWYLIGFAERESYLEYSSFLAYSKWEENDGVNKTSEDYLIAKSYNITLTKMYDSLLYAFAAIFFITIVFAILGLVCSTCCSKKKQTLPEEDADGSNESALPQLPKESYKHYLISILGAVLLFALFGGCMFGTLFVECDIKNAQADLEGWWKTLSDPNSDAPVDCYPPEDDQYLQVNSSLFTLECVFDVLIISVLMLRSKPKKSAQKEPDSAIEMSAENKANQMD